MRLCWHAMKMGVRRVGAPAAQETELLADFSLAGDHAGSAARDHVTRSCGGAMLARPLIPAIRSPASPWISPNTLMVWLTGSTRPSDAGDRGLVGLVGLLDVDRKDVARFQPGEPARRRDQFDLDTAVVEDLQQGLARRGILEFLHLLLGRDAVVRRLAARTPGPARGANASRKELPRVSDAPERLVTISIGISCMLQQQVREKHGRERG